MELSRYVRIALKMALREHHDFLAYLLGMALVEAKGLEELPAHNDNHHDEHEPEPH
jgi:hypothetical protein